MLRVRRSLLASFAVLVAALAIPAIGSAAALTSTFDKNDEGWTLDSTTIGYSADRHAVSEYSSGGFAHSFVAPSSFRTAIAQDYGGVISFDLTATGSLSGPYVVLVSASDAIHCSLSGLNAPANGTATGVVPLTEAGSSACQWTHNMGQPVTAPQFKAILAATTSILISPNSVSGDSHTAYLDNVVLAGVPETTIDPTTPTTFSTSSPSIAFSSDTAGASFTCALDRATPAPCTSPVKYAGLVDGPHTLSVVAAAYGVADPTPATLTFTTQAPVPSTSPAATTPATGTPTVPATVLAPGTIVVPAPALTQIAFSTKKGLTFTASTAGTLTLTLARKATGHKSKSSPTCSTKTKRGTSCTIYLTVSKKTRAVVAGPGSFPINRKGLKQATYRATATLSAGTTTSTPITTTFTVK